MSKVIPHRVFQFNRYLANVLEKNPKKEAKIIVMGYVADLAHIK